MNAVGIDVSKGKSMAAILRPYGEIVSSPFEIRHTLLLHLPMTILGLIDPVTIIKRAFILLREVLLPYVKPCFRSWMSLLRRNHRMMLFISFWIRNVHRVSLTTSTCPPVPIDFCASTTEGSKNT